MKRTRNRSENAGAVEVVFGPVDPLWMCTSHIFTTSVSHFSILFPIRQMEMAKDKFYSACTWNLLKSGMLPGPLVLMVQLTGTSFKRLTSRILLEIQVRIVIAALCVML